MSDQSQNAPVYTAVSTTENDDKPPSYFNVVGQIRAAKSESNNPFEFFSRSVGILCGSIFFTIILAISSILPVAMLIIGILKRDQCIIQSKIPLWLIVMGACGLGSAVLRFLSSMVSCVRNRKNGPKEEPKLLSCFISLIGFFLFVWFIIGNFWVYGIFNEVRYEQDMYPDQYCDILCYRFAFWAITASWILLGACCLCFCGIFCVAVGAAGIAGVFSSK